MEILEGRKEDDEKRSKKRRKSNGDDMLDFVDWLIMKSPPALASKFHVEYINHDPKHQPKCFSISGRDSIINPRRYLCLTWAIEPQRGGSRHVITPSFSRRLLPTDRQASSSLVVANRAAAMRASKMGKARL